MKRQSIFIGIFSILLPLTAVFTQTDLIVIPFRAVGKAILIQGSVDGHIGNLIIDTGIPKMLLNKTYLGGNAKLFRNQESAGFQSLNGASQNAGMSLVFLEIQDFSIKTSAEVVDLKTVERQKGMNILGVLGIDLFRKYEFEIDFFSKEIRLYRLDKKGVRRLLEPQALPTQTLALGFHGHLACVTANLNGAALQLGLDTGAEFNVLPSKVFQKSSDQFKNVQNKTLLDLNGTRLSAFSAQTTGLQIGALDLPPLTSLFVLLGAHYGSLDGKNIHGLLGYEFFQHFRVAINFKKRQVYLWDAEARGKAPVVRGKN